MSRHIYNPGIVRTVYSSIQGYSYILIMPTHSHQAGVTRILKSSPACQSSYLFTRMNVNSEREKFSLQVKLKFGKPPSTTAVTLTQ